MATRILYKTGNYDLTGEDFTWVNDFGRDRANGPEMGSGDRAGCLA